MKNKFLSLALIGIITVISTSWTAIKSPAPKEIVMMIDFDQNVDMADFGPEPNPCNGELVDYTGTIHYVGNFILYDDGSVHLQYHGNFRNVKGIGQVTGDSYKWVGALNQSTNGNVGSTMTVSSLQQCKHKGGSDYKFKWVEHFTINANGDITSEKFVMDEECN